jgi:hypothetical protein
MKKILSILSFAAALSMLTFFLMIMPAYAAEKPSQQSLQVNKKPEIQQVKPRKPVKVRLHRNANGQYSWDITGDSADDVYRADTRLKKLLQKEN